MYDKFGEGLKIERVRANLCRAQVEVQVSPTFWSWLFLFPEEIRIVEPEALVDEYEKQLRLCLEQF